jgi:hypothetical protein
MPLDTQETPLSPDGMNTQADPWKIPEGQARFLQDIVLHKANDVRRRGPVKNGVNSAGQAIVSLDGRYCIGLAGTENPDGVWRIAAVGQGAAEATAPQLHVYATDLQSYASNAYGSALGLSIATGSRHNFSTASHPWGGTLIGFQQRNSPANCSLIHWAGATKADAGTGTISVAQDSVAVTGVGTSFTTECEVGMFLYSYTNTDTSGMTFIGIVKSITNNTSLTLTEGSLYPITTRNYRFQARRALSRRVAKGTITCTENSKIVSGANTKFVSQGLRTPTGGGKWAIFRADDMKLIGTVASVASDIQLTLAANASVTLNKGKFVAIDMLATNDVKINSATEHGWIAAQFAGRMWYANRPFSNRNTPTSQARIFFSDTYDPEALDLTAAGDHFLIPSESPPLKPVLALAPTEGALLVFKEDEVYGIYGTDETNFAIRKLPVDDGCFGATVVQKWNDGVIWAGQKGIWFYDGTEVFNLIEDRLDDWYEQAVQTFKSDTYGAWAMVYNGNYLLYIDKATPPFGPDKTENDSNGTGTPLPYLGLCINLERRAVSTLKNVSFQGSVAPDFEETLGRMYLVNARNSTTPWAFNAARLCNTKDLFEGRGLDTLFTYVIDPATNALGPDFYFESKRYDLNNPHMKKRWKQLMLNYRLDSIEGDFVTLGKVGDGLTDYDNNYLAFATMIGLNNMAIESRSRWRITRAKDADKVWREAYQPARVKFNKRSQYLGFKLWQSNSTGIEHISLASASLAFKFMRPGRV